MLAAFGGIANEMVDVFQQTVPLAELAAVCWLASNTTGNIVVYSDCAYVVQQVQSNSNKALAGTHGEWIWHLRHSLQGAQAALRSLR